MAVKTLILASFTLLLCSTIAYSQSCDNHPNAPYNFNDIKLVLDKNDCNSCHNGIVHSWNYNDYEAMFNLGQCGEPIIIKKDASRSLLFDKINGGQSHCGEPMKNNGKAVSQSDVIAIEKWINYGAPEFCVPFYNEIKEALDIENCNSCHISGNSENLWHYDSYDDMFINSLSSQCNEYPVILPYFAEESTLHQKLIGTQECGESMPPGTTIDRNTISKIRDWINLGTPESAISLPVEISYFDVSYKADFDIEIVWITQSESNVDYFEIQSSKDGIHFSKLETTQSLGNSLQTTKYQLSVELPDVGLYYFRIKTVDFDGKIDYSIMRQVSINANKSFLKVTPNPIKNMTNIEVEWFSNTGQDAVRCMLMDSKGNLVLTSILYEGVNIVSLPFLQEGIYYLQASEYSGKLLLERLVIVN
jgi:hypothetical protein